MRLRNSNAVARAVQRAPAAGVALPVSLEKAAPTVRGWQEDKRRNRCTLVALLLFLLPQPDSTEDTARDRTAYRYPVQGEQKDPKSRSTGAVPTSSSVPARLCASRLAG